MSRAPIPAERPESGGPARRDGARGSLDILHANGVRAYQPRATPWENRRVIPTRAARAGAATSVPKVTLIEGHLIALQQRPELCL